MALIRFVFWGSIFVACTFAFTVVFEHGPMNFMEDAKKEKIRLTELFGKKVDRKADGSDKLTPALH